MWPWKNRNKAKNKERDELSELCHQIEEEKKNMASIEKKQGSP